MTKERTAALKAWFDRNKWTYPLIGLCLFVTSPIWVVLCVLALFLYGAGRMALQIFDLADEDDGSSL